MTVGDALRKAAAEIGKECPPWVSAMSDLITGTTFSKAIVKASHEQDMVNFLKEMLLTNKIPDRNPAKLGWIERVNLN